MLSLINDTQNAQHVWDSLPLGSTEDQQAGIRRTPRGSRVMPLRDAQGVVQMVQVIPHRGPRQYWPEGGRVAGVYHWMPGPESDRVLVETLDDGVAAQRAGLGAIVISSPSVMPGLFATLQSRHPRTRFRIEASFREFLVQRGFASMVNEVEPFELPD